MDNFVRAATDIELDKYVALAGGVNRFFHFREPAPVDDQPTIRMNRDTVYSTVVVDISEGATLTLPEAGERYMSAMVVNQDHYVNEVFHGGGTYSLDMETFDTPYVIVFIRTLVDADDPGDIAAVNALQDAMTIEAASADPFILPNYDEESFEGLVRAALELGRYATAGTRGAAGAKDDVDPLLHFLVTAVGWGLLPEEEAFYLGVEPRLPVGEYKLEMPAEVPVGAFWSVSLYNAEGFFEPNAIDGYIVNSVMGERNDDGSMTVHFGGCDDGRVNCLPIMEGWNYTVRMYQPGPEILDGSWVFPAVEAVN
ncbi:carboxylesterase [Ruegeria marisrubri]|uniref:Carboxylesterase n=1 Tax=Ruegeria marisrubri TaxID=1685379 RepID=A0A0X3TRF9_9RHOB|nr:carboxylesterase [Ruegeria marisrubri]